LIGRFLRQGISLGSCRKGGAVQNEVSQTSSRLAQIHTTKVSWLESPKPAKVFESTMIGSQEPLAATSNQTEQEHDTNTKTNIVYTSLRTSDQRRRSGAGARQETKHHLHHG